MADSDAAPTRSRFNRTALRRWIPPVVVAVACLATAVAYFVPFWPELAEGAAFAPDTLARVFFHQGTLERFAGGGQDLGGTLWTYDHVARMLAGTAGTVDPTLFVPVGFDVGRAQGFAWLDALLAWPLVQVLGSTGFYNLWILLVLAGDVLCFYLLFREAGPPWVVALVLAVACTWSPYVREELHEGRPTQVLLWFHALGLQQVVRLLTGRGRPWVAGLAAGTLLAAACYVYWFGAIPVIVAAGVAVALHLVLVRADRRGVLTGAAVLALALGLLTVLPTWRVSGLVLAGRTADVILADPVRSVGIPGLVTIPVRSTGVADVGGPGDVLRIVRATGAPWGILLLGLGVLLLPRGWRRHGPWAVASLVVATLPWGGSVRLVGTSVTLPTASGLLEQVFPPLTRCHFPERMLTGSLLAAALAVALAAGAVRRWPAVPRRAVLGAVVVLLAIEGIASRPEHPAQVMTFGPEAVYQVIAERWPGGIVDVPLAESNATYAFQIFHRQPLLGGPATTSAHVRPAAHRAWCEANSLLRALEAVALGRPPMPAWDRADLVRLRDAGLATIVLQPTVQPRGAIVASVGGYVYQSRGYTVLSIRAAIAASPAAGRPPPFPPAQGPYAAGGRR